MKMSPWKTPNNPEVQERIAALKALGHSGEAERHSRRALQTRETYGLVYEKTARALLKSLSKTRFRELVLPDRFVANPAYSTAPKVPVYDPRWLMTVRNLIASNNEPALTSLRNFTAERRNRLDAEVSSGYADFVARAKLWNRLRAERCR